MAIRIGENSVKRIERLAKSKGVTTSAMARELLEQALDRKDTSQAIVELSGKIAEALLQLSEVRGGLARQEDLLQRALQAQLPSLSIHEYKAKKGIR